MGAAGQERAVAEGSFGVAQTAHGAEKQDAEMRRQIARAAEQLTIVSAVGAFATLMLTLRFAWSASSTYVGAVVTGALWLLAVVGACVGGVAKQASEPEL